MYEYILYLVPQLTELTRIIHSIVFYLGEQAALVVYNKITTLDLKIEFYRSASLDKLFNTSQGKNLHILFVLS